MQQTFPAGTAQKIVIFDVSSDLAVHGWDQQTIQVTTDGRIEQLQPEGDILTIRGCDDSLELWVPVETVIGARSIDGEVTIENVREVEVDAIGGDVSVKNISGNVELEEIDGDATLTSIGGDLELNDIAGDLIVKQSSSARIRGKVGGDAAFLAVARLDIEKVDGDLALEDTQETTAGRVGGDLDAKNGIAVLHVDIAYQDRRSQRLRKPLADRPRAFCGGWRENIGLGGDSPGRSEWLRAPGRGVV